MVDVEIGFRNGDSIHTEIDDESAVKFVEIYSALISEKKTNVRNADGWECVF